MDDTDVIPQIYLNGEVIPVVDSDKHLGNYISINITDRNIINNICDLYQRSNRDISDFRVSDTNALDNLHRTYCMHMYGCELWDINCNYIKTSKWIGGRSNDVFGGFLTEPTMQLHIS